MNEYTPDRANEFDLTAESIAVNIRRYLDAHRSDPNGATPVVANLETGGASLEEHESRSNELADPEVTLAIDTLLHHINSQVP